jgi:hypothetical protein
MTDFAAPTETVGSKFDVTNLDRTVQAISAVERTWRQPRLPDEARVDLASLPGVTPEGIVGFLQGIDTDLGGPQQGAAVPEDEDEPQRPRPRVQFQEPEFGTSGMDQARVYLGDLAGNRVPTDPTIDAVKRFKLKAIEQGYLEASDGVIDDSWSPEYNSLLFEMAMDDYERRLAGDRIGAAPTNRVMDLIHDWTQPTGLLAAATELDLFWDFGAINREFSSWGDKFRAIDQAKNPLDFGLKLVDALTGPLDDIAVPIINWALIGTGFAGVSATYKAGMFASRYGKAGRVLDGLYRVSGVRTAANMKAMSTPSWTAKRLMASSGDLWKAVGGGMKAWRGNDLVRRTKMVTQAGMRMGFVSQAEDLLPGYQGGWDLAGDEDNRTLLGAAADSFRDFGLSPLVAPLELALAPYNIFNPGSFVGPTGLVSRTASGLYRVTGSAPGRAGIGALAGAAAGNAFGEDGGDIGLGALIGAAGGAALPGLGRVAGASPALTRTAIGGTIGGGIGYLLDDSKEDGVDAMDVLAGTMVGALGAAALPFATAANPFRNGVSLVGAKSVWNSYNDEVRARSGKYIGHVSDFLQHTSFKPLAENQHVTSWFDKSMRGFLEAEDPDGFARYMQGWNEDGNFLGAVRRYANLADDEEASAMVTFVMLSAAIDHKATLAVGKHSNTAWHLHRNKLIAQTRIFDTSGSMRLEDLAAAMAANWVDSSPQRFQREYTRILETLRANPERALELAENHNKLANESLRDLLDAATLNEDVLMTYLPQAIPTFGNWGKFTEATSEIDTLFARGDLDLAEFLPTLNRWGNPVKGIKDEIKLVDVTRVDATGSMIDAVLGNTAVKLNKNISVLATQQPRGRMTVMLRDTMSRQQKIQKADELRGLMAIKEGLVKAHHSGLDVNVILGAGRDAGYTAEQLGGMPLAQLQEIVKSATGSTKFSGTMKNLYRYAASQGMSPEMLMDQIDTVIQRTLDDSAFWASAGLRSAVRGDKEQLVEGVDALRFRIKELNESAHYTAAEIDADGLIRKLREAGDEEGAQRIEILRDMLDEKGYKLAHGSEFLQAHAINGMGGFEDMATRHMHGATIGNFFRGKLPAEARALEERSWRTAMADALSERLGLDLHPNDPQVTRSLDSLNTLIREMQEDDARMMGTLWQETWWRRRKAALDTSFTPLKPDDAQRHRTKLVQGLIGLGHKEDEALAIAAATPKMRLRRFEDLGLYAIEAWARSENQGLWVLKSAPFVGAAVAGYAGWDYASRFGANEDQTRGAQVLGGLGGAALGGAFGAGAQKWLTKPIADSRWGYMADELVRIRDAVRFTLSPTFDISRYTEGLMLAQTAAPLRRADGTRMALRLNMTPTGLRRAWKKAEIAKGAHKGPELERAAQNWFDTQRTAFNKAARGDFDVEAIDSAGRWFRNIGIMGFSPIDWMTAAFAELRLHQGMDPESAYRAVREMYTYGVRGRSAAEMSVNFVSFPFSFQKKALTHIAKWMNDDLSRSILLHDAFKAYEMLDEKYNLDEFWRDHVPALNQLKRLNMFAFGLSPGRLGGINRNAADAGYRTALTLFMPGGFSIRNEEDREELQRVYRRLLPALNDINWMTQDLKEQTLEVGLNGMTSEAQIRQGFEEFNEYKKAVGRQLDSMGYTWSDLMRKPHLASMKASYEVKRAEIGERYPAWFDRRTKSTQNRVALEMEKKDRLTRAAEDPQEALASDVAMAQMEDFLAQLAQELAYRGVDVGSSEWENAPPEVFTTVREFALKLYGVPGFPSVWRKFYRNEFGVLEAPLA